MSTSTSAHEFVRKHTHTATRNFDQRVKMFIKTIVMNSFSPLNVREYSYRVEFQMRGNKIRIFILIYFSKIASLGAPHIHGILFVDVDEIVKQDKERGNNKLEFLKSALQTIYDDHLPSEDQKDAIEAYIDQFVTCSLLDPETREIALDVQIHKHTKTCTSRGPDCRFYFPLFPSLRTIISVPIRLVYPDDEEQRKELRNKINLVLGAVQRVLENKEEMDRADNIVRDELDQMVEDQDLAVRAKRILEDKIFVSQLEKGTKEIYHECRECPQSTLSETEALLIENLNEFKLHYESLARDQQLKLPAWRKRRLLYVLKKAKLFNILEVDSSQDGAEELLLQIYHNLLGFSLKGFSVILVRDVAEIFVNKYNPEWLKVTTILKLKLFT